MAKWSDDKTIKLQRFCGRTRQQIPLPPCGIGTTIAGVARLPAYNLVMARGWESKGVESQMDAAQEQPARPPRRLTEEEKRRQRERQGLILARTHIQQQLDASTSEQYSESLRRAMADLDEKISALDAAS